MLSIRNMCLIGALTAITACGSSGRSDNPSAQNGSATIDTSLQARAAFQGSTAAATVNTGNLEELSIGATEATKRVLDGFAAPIPVAVEESAIEQEIAERNIADVRKALLQTQLPSGFTQVEQCSEGGSFTVNAPGISENATSLPSSGVIETTYVDCVDGGTILDGYVVLSYSGGWDINADQGPRNYTVTFDLSAEAYGQYVYDVAGQMTCTDFGNSCTFGQNFEENGVSYRVESLDDGSDNAYDVYARVYVGDEGYIEFTAWDISIMNGQVCSGNILVSDTSGTDILEVEFPDCSTMIVHYNGETHTYNQN